MAFYIVIIRVGARARSAQISDMVFGSMATDDSLSVGRRRGMQVHITTSTESKVDHGQCSSTPIMMPINSKSGSSKIKFACEEGRCDLIQEGVADAG